MAIFQIPSTAAKPLRAMLGLSEQQLSDLADGLRTSDPSETFKNTSTQLAPTIKANEEAIADILRFVLEISLVRRSLHMDPSEFAESLAASIDSSSIPEELEDDWSDDAWVKLAPFIEDAVRDNSSVYKKAKAISLTNDFPAVAREFEILTDSRLIFDDSGEVPSAGVITHQLVIDYYDSQNGDSKIFVRLDTNDISQLIRLCERSLRKDLVYRKHLHDEGVVDLTDLTLADTI